MAVLVLPHQQKSKKKRHDKPVVFCTPRTKGSVCSSALSDDDDDGEAEGNKCLPSSNTSTPAPSRPPIVTQQAGRSVVDAVEDATCIEC
jgi:hypothetical protein